MAALTIAVELLKGGTGKTTTALALAEAAAGAGAGSVLLADTDPQGSALRWADLAADSGRPLRSTVVGLATPDLSRRLPSLAASFDVVVIDGPPGALPIARAAVALADVVVVPCVPKLAELDRVPATAELAAEAGVPVVVVFVMARAGTRATDAAREALTGAGLTVADTVLPLREAVAGNYGRPPVGPLSTFGVELLDELTRPGFLPGHRRTTKGRKSR